MRTQIRFGFVALFYVSVGLAHAAEPSEETTPESPVINRALSGWLPDLQFEGNQSFSDRDLCDGLEANYDLALALRLAEPHADLAPAIVNAVKSGYLHAGFPDVEVHAETDLDTGRIRLHIAEGPRYVRGEIQIIGTKQVSSELLIRRLTERTFPLNAIPITRETGMERSEPVWVITGKSACKSKSPRWSSGKHSQFDQLALAEIRHELEQGFQIQGYFSSRFKIDLIPDRSRQTSNLLVTIEEEGDSAVVDSIVVKGDHRSSSASVLEYLGVRPGMKYTARTNAELERRLWESGRYLRHTISARFHTRSESGDASDALPIPVDEGPSTPDQANRPETNRVELLITLEENPAAPELGAKLTEVQEALLNASRWLERWSVAALEQEFGFEFACEFPYPKTEMPLQLLIRSAGGVDRAAVLAVSLGRNGSAPAFQQTGAFTPEQTVVLSSRSPVRYESRSPADLQVLLILTILPNPEQSDSMFYLGFHWKSLGGKSANPLRLQLGMTPSSAFRLSSYARARCQISDDLLLVDSEEIHFEFDVRSGALRSIRLKLPDNGLTFAGQSEPGIVDRALDEFRQLRSKSRDTAPEASVSDSLLRYFAVAIGELIAEESSPDDRPSILALTRLLSRWQIPAFPLLADMLSTEKADGEWFFVPAPRAEFSTRLTSIVWNRSMSGVLIPIMRSALPRDGSLHEIGRDSLLAFPNESAKPQLMELIDQRSRREECGPLATMLQVALTNWDPDASAALSRQAFLCMSEDLFAKDCQLLLSGDGWLSECLISLLAAVRDLSPDEIRALIRFWPGEGSRDAIATAFLNWKDKPETPALPALTPCIPHLWSRDIRSGLGSFFLRIADRATRDFDPASVFSQPEEPGTLADTEEEADGEKPELLELDCR